LFVLILIFFDIILSFNYYVLVRRNFRLINNYNVDAAIVLFGGFSKNDGINNETMRRLNYAIQLYQKNRIKYILCVGGARPSKNLYGAELMKEFVIQHGVPKNEVFSERKSYDTITNLQEAVNMMTRYNWNSAFLISSPLHLFRIKNIFEIPAEFDIKFLPYDNTIKPDINLGEILIQTHYEYVAFIFVIILPDSMYNSIVKFLRK